CDEATGWLTLRRGSLLIAVNIGQADWVCDLGKNPTLLAGSDPGIRLSGDGLVLPPDTAAIALRPGPEH
ncbi:MAG TPA: hypothetical protein VEV63_12110, partial [Streptosporangiaceae bacterium]|nr:hypothetical protein [Streptosporangiaceae bacterium]